MVYLGGDPNFLGWATFALYMVAGFCCFRVAQSKTNGCADVASSWKGLAIGLLALGLNKQLDLQTLLIRLGRTLAKAMGVSPYRREIQLWFTIGLLLVLVAGILLLRRKLVAFAREHALATTGAALVCSYAVCRAVSIDHVDAMLGFDLDETPLLWLLEVVGLIMVIIAVIIPGCKKRWPRRP